MNSKWLLPLLNLYMMNYCQCKLSQHKMPLGDMLGTSFHRELKLMDLYLNLTEWVVKDTTIKLWHAEHLQDGYKHLIGYELGIISAAIVDHFKEMIEIYQKYSDINTFQTRYYYLETVLNGLHIIMGNYNQIRMVVQYYFEVKKKHDDRKAASDRIDKALNRGAQNSEDYMMPNKKKPE